MNLHYYFILLLFCFLIVHVLDLLERGELYFIEKVTLLCLGGVLGTGGANV